MKKLLALLLVVLMLVPMFGAAAEEKITITFWSFTDELSKIVDDYYKPAHPEVEIVYVLTPTADFPGKLDPMLATNAAEAPDVFALEADFAKKYIESEHTASLLDLGFTEEDLKAAVPAVVDFGRDPSGTPKALSWQATPGALFYRASLAEKYLGVKTPEEFQELVKDVDAFYDTALKLDEASNGEVKMFSSLGDIVKPFLYLREKGWVADNKLVIEDVLLELMDLAKDMKTDGLYNEATQWQESWFLGMKSDITMCYFLPTWGLHYVLKPNSRTDTTVDPALGNGTYGDWRMVNGPVGYSWGGTWLGANAAKVAEASDAKKAAIKELINFITMDPAFLTQYAKDSGDFVSNIEVAKAIAAEATPNDFLGGQDHYGAFAASSLIINASNKTAYDLDIERLFNDNCLIPYVNGEKDKDTAIADFKAAVAALFNNITVE